MKKDLAYLESSIPRQIVLPVYYFTNYKAEKITIDEEAMLDDFNTEITKLKEKFEN